LWISFIYLRCLNFCSLRNEKPICLFTDALLSPAWGSAGLSSDSRPSVPNWQTEWNPWILELRCKVHLSYKDRRPAGVSWSCIHSLLFWKQSWFLSRKHFLFHHQLYLDKSSGIAEE
jgi:hypothetical protein